MPVRRKKSAGLRKWHPAVDGITQSLLARYLSCKTMARQTVAGWSGTGFELATIQGNLVHRALELLYEWSPPPWTINDVEQTLATACSEIQEESSRSWTPEQWQKWELMPFQLRPVLFGYGHYWASADSSVKWLETEAQFSINVPEVGVRVRGKRDAALVKPDRRRKSGGSVWLFETKTRGEISATNLLLSLHRDLQVNTYLWALDQHRMPGYEEQSPAGVFYNVVRRTRLRLKTDEDPADYEERIAADIVEKGEDHYYKRFEVAVTPDDLAAFRTEFYTLLQEVYDWWKAGMPGMIYGMPCINKFGPCAYIALCHEGTSAGLRMRRKMFEEL